jgi:hypothetical protein
LKTSDWLFIIFLILLSLFATKSLWHTGLFTSHDGPHQAVRLFYYEQSLKEGLFPPRYVLPALHGFGYPLFVFNYHLPWLLALPFSLLGLSIYDCIKVIFIITFIVSGITMYLWQKKLFGPWPAFVGAFLYLWAPYRFLDIYVRGSLGEAVTFMFLPLVLWGLTICSRSDPERNRVRPYIIGAIGIAGVILSHSLIFLLFLPVIILSNLSNLKRMFASVLLGFSLSAFYLFPAFLLKKDTVFTRLMAGTTSGFADHFPTIHQLLYSPWGYGFSFPGPNDEMSFQVGIAQWIVVGLSLLLFFTPGVEASGAKKDFQVKRKLQGFMKTLFFSPQGWIGLTFLLTFAFSIFMMQPVSTPVWKLVNQFAYIDYPWRYLFLSVFSASVLGGFCVNSFKLPKSPRFLKLLKPQLFLGVFLVAVAFYTNRNNIRVNAWLDWSVQAFVGDGDTSNTYEEYSPIQADKNYMRSVKELIQVLKGEGRQDQVVKKTSQISFNAQNNKDSLYRVNVWYFPQVKVLVDGKPVVYSYKDKGVLDFWVGQGSHQVKIDFIRTKLEKIGLVISGISLIILLFEAKPRTNHKPV